MTERSDRPRGAATLWLPLGSPRWAWGAVVAVAAALVASMSRDLSWFDSAELAAVAVQGSLGHPIGQPVHTIVGFLLAHVPGLPPLIGVNLLSALPHALALIPLISLAEALAGASTRRGLMVLTLAVLVLHPVLFENASRVEVYSVATFFALWAVARVAALLAGEEPRSRGWLAAGLALGLSASTNAYIALIAALGLAPAVVTALVRRRLAIAGALGAVLGGVLGLLPYLYVPLIARREGVFLWGLPRDGAALLRYFGGADYGHNREVTWPMVGDHVVSWLAWAATSGIAPFLLLGLAAHLLWGRQAGLGRSALAIHLGLMVLMLATNAIFIPEIPDYDGYLAVPLLLAAAGAAALVGRISALDDGRARSRLLAAALALALVASVVFSSPALYGRTRYRDHVARTLAQGALESAPRNAILVVGSDHWVFPLLYLQEAERRRPDVTVLAEGLAGSSWYWPQLYERHPDLAPIALRAPGGTPARIRRFLRANADRNALFETWTSAAAYGRPTCLGPWLVMDGPACEDADAPPAEALAPAMERALAEVGAGSPVTDAVIARVTRERGEALWRMGHPSEALRALMAGVPTERRPRGLAEDRLRQSRLSGPPMRWPEPEPLIGAHWQNLFVAAQLLASTGEPDAAAEALRMALEAGVPPQLVTQGGRT